MKALHLMAGTGLFLAFLLTGQYMEFHDPRMEQLGEGTRMMFRSRHIYILLAGLLNLGVGAYFSYREQWWRQVLQVIASSLIILAPWLLIGAFFYEPKLTGLERPLTLPAVIALSLGTFGHLLSGLWQSQKSAR